MAPMKTNDIIIYASPDGTTLLEVHLDHETVWLTQKQMAELFGKTIPTINEHIKNIFKDGELEESPVIRNFRITAADGKTYDKDSRAPWGRSTRPSVVKSSIPALRKRVQTSSISSLKTMPSATATNGSQQPCLSISSA